MAELTVNELKSRINEIEERISNACLRSGRNREDVRLIAVTKTHPVETLQNAYELGLRCFGENKVQEITSKIPELPDDISWHLIGHLQRNKVKMIVKDVEMIHSVDSLRLAEAIEKEAAKIDRVIPVLIEVNVAEEESKFGVKLSETKELVREAAKLPHLRISGLMTIAPNVSDPEENRPVFKKLRELLVDIRNENIDNVNMSALSMGMSGDFEVAIEEGATMVRVGSSIFGMRDYSRK